jgi:hypothetical protein
LKAHEIGNGTIEGRDEWDENPLKAHEIGNGTIEGRDENASEEDSDGHWEHSNFAMRSPWARAAGSSDRVKRQTQSPPKNLASSK